MKAILCLLMLTACGGGNQPPANKPAGGIGSSAAGSNAGNCLTDADCGEGERCDTCPSTCGANREACTQVCGAPVCK
jgi:Cys-rich repeat protein